jgi:hypothetical protein
MVRVYIHLAFSPYPYHWTGKMINVLFWSRRVLIEFERRREEGGKNGTRGNQIISVIIRVK